ncbi:MAG: hypothetical protein SNH16_07250 [Rikenellaceae bacterium]
MKIIVFLQSKAKEESSSAGEQLARNRLYDYTAEKEYFGAPFLFLLVIFMSKKTPS